jgi:hypothetical protein
MSKLFAALLLCFTAFAAEEMPAWLRQARDAAPGQYDAKVHAVVLLNEERAVVGDGGKVTTTTRTATRILHRQGSSVRYFEQYDTSGDRVRDFQAWMVSPAGKVKKFGKDEIVDAACAPNDVFNECRRRIVSGESDAEDGSVFAYEATVERKSFSSQMVFHFQDALPVCLARFQVVAPAGWTLKSAAFNGAPTQPSESGGVWTWQMENLAAIEIEPLAPSADSLAPWVGVNLVGAGVRPVLTWPDASKLLAELNTGAADVTPAIAAKAKALTSGASTEMEKIRAIGRFVQQVNYVSIQVDIAKGGGYRPHSAASVLEKLYGDCKDKANLMRALLSASGITAYPVVVYSGDRTRVSQDWPSLGVFNHAISAIPVSAQTVAAAVTDTSLGRLLFFDPTDSYVQPGYLPGDEQGSLALVAAGEKGELVRLPSAPAAAATRTRTVEATLGEDGSVNGTFTDTRTGESVPEALGVYRETPHADYQEGIGRWITSGVPGATASGVEVTAEEASFVIKGKFASPRFAQRPQSRMLIFRAAPLRHLDLASLTSKTRKYPVELDADALHETVRITIPAGYRIDETPDPVHLKTAFGTFDATWSASGSNVVFERRLEVQACSVSAAQYTELKKFLDTAEAAEESPVVLLK